MTNVQKTDSALYSLLCYSSGALMVVGTMGILYFVFVVFIYLLSANLTRQDYQR
jgi:hypothetical protein